MSYNSSIIYCSSHVYFLSYSFRNIFNIFIIKMADQVSPFIRTIFTDITGGMLNHQFLGKCAKQEMVLMECLEAYGLDRGLRRCAFLIDDYKECQTNKKQFMRFMAMRKERDRQIACGKLSEDKKYVSPKLDSF